MVASVVHMSKHTPIAEAPKREKRTLSTTDIETQLHEPESSLKVRTDVRAGAHGSDFNGPKR